MKRLKLITWTLWHLIPFLWKHADAKYVDVGTFYTDDEENWKEYTKLRTQIKNIIDPLYGIRIKVKPLKYKHIFKFNAEDILSPKKPSWEDDTLRY